MQSEKIKLAKVLEKIGDYFSPKVVGEVNDVYVKVAKIKGDELPWHNHKEEDELFLILKGSLFFEIEGEDGFVMEEGELFVIPRGINHRVSSVEECQILLVENKTTAHTGEIVSTITRTIADQLE
ncbi:MAG: cupin domain-containing protein [Saprospiraceae bacterium]|nr:cupin domain-containing protein [Saprospiraceae bacterium]